MFVGKNLDGFESAFLSLGKHLLAIFWLDTLAPLDETIISYSIKDTGSAVSD